MANQGHLLVSGPHVQAPQAGGGSFQGHEAPEQAESGHGGFQ